MTIPVRFNGIRTVDMSVPRVDTFGMLSQIGDTVERANDKRLKAKEDAEAGELLAKAIAAHKQNNQNHSNMAAPLLNMAQPQTTAPQQAAGKAPTFAAMQGTEPTANFKDMFSGKEQEYALPEGYLTRTAAIESRFNPNAQNPKSSAGGLFQFIDSTAKEYGLVDKFDPVASTDAAARLAANNKTYLTNVLGREPTAGELYLAHQQGAAGAAKLLSNPDAPAVSVVGAKALKLNGGNENMSAGQFASLWTGKVDGQADAPAPGARNAQFAIPGRTGLPGAHSAGGDGIDPSILAALARNPQTRNVALQLFAKNMESGSYGFTTVGDQLVRTHNRTGEVTVVPGITKPNVEVKELNGKLLLVDKSQGVASDITPEGSTSGYRPMTAEERQAFGIPGETGGYIGPDGKPGALAGTTRINNNLPGQKLEDEYDKTVGKNYGETFVDLQKQGRSSISLKNSLRLLDRLSRDPDFYSGFGGEKQMSVNRALAAMGIKDPKAAAPSEAFSSIVNEVVLGKLGGSLGAGVSNADVGFLQSAGPNLANTKEGNRLLIALTGKIADRQAEIAKLARDYAKNSGGRIDQGFDDMLAEFAEQNPLFTEEDYKAAQAAMNGETIGGSSTTPPKPGDEMDGYIFKGGDPASPNSWQKKVR